MEDYFTKRHLTHHHKEIRLTYLYMANSILKLNPTVVQGCVDVVHMYGHTKLPTIT